MPSELFRAGTVGDDLANELAAELCRADGFDVGPDHNFSVSDVKESGYRVNAELAILWSLKPNVRARLGRLR